jgi:hypothetical protein
VSATPSIPRRTEVSLSDWNDLSVFADRGFPACCGERRTCWKRGAENIWRSDLLGLAGKVHPPTIAAFRDGGVEQLRTA